VLSHVPMFYNLKTVIETVHGNGGNSRPTTICTAKAARRLCLS
jgi:hypothetical protein